MATIQATSIADVLINSLNELGRLKFTDLMSNYQNTIALKRIFRQKKMTIENGPEVQFNVMIDTNGSARHVGLGYTTSPNMVNVLAVGKMPWRHTHWEWCMERRLVQMNSGRAKIIDMAQTQRIAAFGDAIKKFEYTLWRVPSLAAFEDEPVGIPYFVVKTSTDAATDTTNEGFNGTVPSGYTLVANLNPTTSCNGRWKNYADAYTLVTKDDLVEKMHRARFYTDFQPLVDEVPEYDTGYDYGIYTNYATRAKMRQILESSNENLGSDFEKFNSSIMFGRTNVTAVVELKLDTTDPVYMLNWGVFGAQALKNEWMNEQHFEKNPHQPTMTLHVTDCTWNMYCQDRRKQAVLSTGTGMSY